MMKRLIIGIFALTFSLMISSSKSVWASCGPSKLGFKVQAPATATTGTNFSSFAVMTENVGGGSCIISKTITLTAFTTADCSTTPGSGVITNGSLLNTAGTSTFTTMRYSAAETIYLLASTAGLTSVCSTAIVVSAPAPVAAKVVFTTQPSTTSLVNSNLAQQPTVTVEDAGGATATGYSTAVTLAAFTDNLCTVADSGATLSGSATTTSGLASFSGVQYTKAGMIYLKATSGALTSDCSAAITFSPGAATKLIFTTQPSGTSTINTNLAQQPVLTAEDATGNTVPSYSTAVTLAPFTNNTCTVADSGGTLGGTTTTTSGIATYSGVKYTKIGGYYFKATSGSLTAACSSQAQFTAGVLASFKSCRKLTSQGYTVDNTSERVLTGTACSANEIPQYSTVNGIPTPVCVKIDCGVEPKVCRNTSLITMKTDYFCASCAGGACP